MKLLLFPDPTDGGETPPAPAPAGEPPKAAKAVLNSDAKEEDAAEMVRLKHQLEEERGRSKALAEENAKLKAPPPQPPQPEKKKSASDWFF